MSSADIAAASTAASSARELPPAKNEEKDEERTYIGSKAMEKRGAKVHGYNFTCFFFNESTVQ